MAIKNSKNVGLEICKALNAAEKKVRSITIKIQPDDVVRIDTVEFMTNKQFDELIEVIKHYHLEPDGKN